MKISVCVFMILCSLSTAFAQTSPVELALKNPSRPKEDTQADERRHARELLEFSQIKDGEKVIDFLPGKGYFTRLFIHLVGPKGQVTAYVPKELEGAHFKPVEAAKKAVEGAKNAQLKVTPLTVAPAENVDVIWTAQNYHDLHIKTLMKADVPAFNRLMFKMLKPGGRLIIIDHVAASGAGIAEIEKLHRIDPQTVRKEVEAAGFVFEAESKVLATNEDHKLNVFDPAIRGKTDQFAFRFIKPKK